MRDRENKSSSGGLEEESVRWCVLESVYVYPVMGLEKKVAVRS